MDQDGATALIWASAEGRLEVVQLLCEAGADKDKADRDGDTALICVPQRAPGVRAVAQRAEAEEDEANE